MYVVWRLPAYYLLGVSGKREAVGDRRFVSTRSRATGIEKKGEGKREAGW